ncbi:MAG: hypothetical protein Q7I94_05055 [Candidatus Contubernalis sp.]|nr:hypothetical protein [Candidatus Contubernalis sp.]
MTDLETLMVGISTVGFPIVAFLLMFWLVVTVVRDNTKALQELKLVLESWKPH